MQYSGYIGIYISKNSATVACFGPQSRGQDLTGSFTVSVETQQETGSPDITQLAGLIAKGCAEKFPGCQNHQIAVALDCSMFMQHSIHSDFADPKQIASTIRFDTEEALADVLGYI